MSALYLGHRQVIYYGWKRKKEVMLCVGLVIAFEVRKRPVIIVWGMIFDQIMAWTFKQQSGGHDQVPQLKEKNRWIPPNFTRVGSLLSTKGGQYVYEMSNSMTTINFILVFIIILCERVWLTVYYF